MNIIKLLIIIAFIFSTLLPVPADGGDFSEEERESRMGHLLDFYMTESFVMLRDEKIFENITEVVDRIAKVTEKTDSKYLLRLINSPLPIVTSFPGYVYVSSGMLDLLDSEDELAFAISHAIAHVVESDQHQRYVDAIKNYNIADFTGHVMPLLVFSGIGVAAIAQGGMAAASASTFGDMIYIGSGISSAATLAQGSTDTDMHEKKIIHNRLIPHVDLPDIKVGFSVNVFLGDVYGGYGKKEEMQADNLAIGYLDKAGYDPNAILSVLKKLTELKDDYIGRGYIFHLLSANPGLEKRISNANHSLKNYK